MGVWPLQAPPAGRAGFPPCLLWTLHPHRQPPPSPRTQEGTEALSGLASCDTVTWTHAQPEPAQAVTSKGGTPGARGPGEARQRGRPHQCGPTALRVTPRCCFFRKAIKTPNQVTSPSECPSGCPCASALVTAAVRPPPQHPGRGLSVGSASRVTPRCLVQAGVGGRARALLFLGCRLGVPPSAGGGPMVLPVQGDQGLRRLLHYFGEQAEATRPFREQNPRRVPGAQPADPEHPGSCPGPGSPRCSARSPPSRRSCEAAQEPWG